MGSEQYIEFIDFAKKLERHLDKLLSCISGSKMHYYDGFGKPISKHDIMLDFNNFIENWPSKCGFNSNKFERELLTFDTQARKAILKKCDQSLNAELVEECITNVYDIDKIMDDNGYCDNLGSMALSVYISLSEVLHDIADLFDYDIRNMAEANIVKEWHDRIRLIRYYFTFTPTNDTQIALNNPPYKTLPRTHRIAAVWGLIDHLKLRQSVDKTRLAAFVEAVTGGNIDARPQDTVSYKTPTKDAQEAAAELLKKIGIELNLGASDV